MGGEDCYIYWDDEYVFIQCIECHNKNKKGIVWRAAMGYNNKIICSNCKKIIFKGSDEDQASLQDE